MAEPELDYALQGVCFFRTHWSILLMSSQKRSHKSAVEGPPWAGAVVPCAEQLPGEDGRKTFLQLPNGPSPLLHPPLDEPSSPSPGGLTGVCHSHS